MGHGAGPIETASKMLNDMIEILKTKQIVKYKPKELLVSPRETKNQKV